MDVFQYLEVHPGLFLAGGAAVSAVCAVVGVLLTWLKMKNDRNELQEKVGELKHELGKCQERVNGLEKQADETEHEMQAKMAQEQAAQVAALEKQTELSNALVAEREQTARMLAAEQRAARLVKQMLQLEGRLWEKRISSGTPRFRPLSDRKTAIVSVVNLKGGVGKTTITAHLGAAFANRGYQPLLIDLDLQGSLSSMFVSIDDIIARFNDKVLLQHFLSDAANHRRLNMLDVVAPILDGRAGVVPASDTMAYAELNLTLHWLLRLGKRDTRFLLRRALHQKRVTREHGIVLLDCPPLINTCCVNGLAASDYVLIPVMPSRKAMERVPQLLKMLSNVKDRINPHIQPLGLLLNRTYGHKLTALEQELWGQLQDHCQDEWGAPVFAFETHIRQTPEVRDSETQAIAPGRSSELATYFQKLAVEIEERLPRECRRSADASV
jgi:cellulose biosynthesis protein BcsQ